MNKQAALFSAALIALAACTPPVADNNPAGPEPDVLATIAHNESVAVGAEGVVYFTEMATRTIGGFTPGEGLFNCRSNSNRASGLAFDSEGRLVVAEVSTGRRREPRVTRTDMTTGSEEVLATSYQGQPFNGPNDVAVDSRGNVFFTDPGDSAPAGVYRIDLDGSLTRILTAPDIEWPNGIAISPDDRTLYLGESSSAEDGNRLIRAYDLARDGSVSNMRVVFLYQGGHGPDGIALDIEGNLYVAAGSNRRWRQDGPVGLRPGIHVISPEGQVLRVFPVYEDYITDCAFGGPDGKTLYITAGRSLLSVRTEIAGARR
ncbi:MAG: SMP-30/gluconolactonase/LRE family protein [bacterium]|nr:SMP-30/gluconolactonase/LRE family protein [bacterium]